MSVYPIATNFTGLIVPRVSTSTIFSPDDTSATFSGTTPYALSGYMPAGAIITSGQLYPFDGTLVGTEVSIDLVGGLNANTILPLFLANGGATPGQTTLYADTLALEEDKSNVAIFTNVALTSLGGALSQPVPQDSYVTVSLVTSETGKTVPAVLLTYLA